MGRDRRRQDRRPRRRGRVLRPLLRRQHPRSDRAAARPQHLHAELHDAARAAREPAERDADRGAPDRRIQCRRSSTTGASASSATSASTSSPTSAYVGNAARDQLITGRQINGRPVWLRLPAVRASIRRTSAGGQAQPLPRRSAAPVPGLRLDHPARVHRLLGLRLAAVLGEPPPLVRRPGDGRVATPTSW